MEIEERAAQHQAQPGRLQAVDDHATREQRHAGNPGAGIAGATGGFSWELGVVALGVAVLVAALAAAVRALASPPREGSVDPAITAHRASTPPPRE